MTHFLERFLFCLLPSLILSSPGTSFLSSSSRVAPAQMEMQQWYNWQPENHSLTEILPTYSEAMTGIRDTPPSYSADDRLRYNFDLTAAQDDYISNNRLGAIGAFSITLFLIIVVVILSKTDPPTHTDEVSYGSNANPVPQTFSAIVKVPPPNK